MSPAVSMPPPPPLPELRQDVVVSLPAQQQYRGRITKVTDEELVVVLMLDARDPLQPGDVASMIVEYPGPRGLVRLEGRGTVATYDLIRFRLVGAVYVVQLRDFVRVRAVRPLHLARRRPDGSPSAWTETLTVNVSGNGMLAAGPDTLGIGDPVLFRVVLDEGEPAVEGQGRVARVAEGGQRGIKIEEIDRDARRHLVRFIFEQERIARQRTRDGEL